VRTLVSGHGRGPTLTTEQNNHQHRDGEREAVGGNLLGHKRPDSGGANAERDADAPEHIRSPIAVRLGIPRYRWSCRPRGRENAMAQNVSTNVPLDQFAAARKNAPAQVFQQDIDE